MKKNSITLIVLVIFFEFCNAYDYPKPEINFDCEDKPQSPSKPKVLRGVFFYTYDDNYNGREVEMHELNLESFNKLVSSSDYVKTPTAVKSTFNFIEFFDGRCQASVNCERIPQECPSISPCRTTLPPTARPPTSPSSTTTYKPTTTSTTSTTKPPTTTTKPPTTITIPLPAKNYLEQKITNIFQDVAPQLTKSQLDEIMTAFKHIAGYTQYWNPHQVNEISTRSSLIHQNEMLRQNTSVNAVMRFSDEIKQHMIGYISELDPYMSLKDILGMISAVEEVGTATMRYMTLEQFIELRGPVVAEFVKNTEINGYVTTTQAPSKAPTTTKAPTTSRSPVTTTTKSSTTSAAPTTTKKPISTTKTYIPPPGISRKPYTHFVGTYRLYTGQYSFGYTWKPFTGGYSWKSRPYTAGTTTTTQRYGQKEYLKVFNPVGNE